MTVRTNFDPVKHAFAFRNEFDNVVLVKPDGTPWITTRGRCGGMAFAALDYYFAGLPVPITPTPPANGTLLADYIYKRLIDSFSLSGPKFIALTGAPDHRTWFSAGLTQWTKVDECAKIREQIDAGTPAILGLISTTGLADHHTVVVHGYDASRSPMSALIYDNNAGRGEVRLDSSDADPHYHSTRGDEWRGFFVEWYSPTVPDYLREGRLMREASNPRVYVIYGGAKFLIPDPATFDAMGFISAHIVPVPDGSLAYIATIPGDGTLLKERSIDTVFVMVDGKRLSIPSAADFDAHGFSWARVRTVPDGALAAIPSGGVLPPAPPPPPVWSQLASGTMRTSDPADQLDYRIEHDAVDTEFIEFRLMLANAVSWKKQMNLPHLGANSWTIVAEGAGRMGVQTMPAGLIAAGQILTLSKAKFLGTMTLVLVLRDLTWLRRGDRVSFTWMHD